MENRNYWLHRISHEGELARPLLNQGFLTIGFSEFSNLNYRDEILSNGESALNVAFQKEWGNVPRTRKNLLRFVQSMKTGDWIIVPGWHEFSVFELTGGHAELIADIGNENLEIIKNYDLREDGKLYTSQRTIDIGFYWRVKPICLNINRSLYATADLTSRLKLRLTNAYITDLKDSINDSIVASQTKSPLNLIAEISEKSIPVILNEIITKLNPTKFENLIRSYFEKIGATKASIPSRNASGKKGDADIIAEYEHLKLIIYVQAKYHTGETNNWAIDQILTYKNHKNDIMDDEYTKIPWVITTAEKFSEEAINKAKENNVLLINGKDFAAMLLGSGMDKLSEL